MCLGPQGGKYQATGRSRGGQTTQIHALTDSVCRLIPFILRNGQKQFFQGRLAFAEMFGIRPFALYFVANGIGCHNHCRRAGSGPWASGSNIRSPALQSATWPPVLYRDRNAIERMFGRLKGISAA